MPMFVNASNVRSYAHIDGIDEPWSEANLGSNIRAASAFLQKNTHRQFELQLGVTKKFTTNGDAYITLPDLRSVTSITRAASSQTADSDYHLIPDHQQTGVYIGIQFRPFGSRASYLSYSDWFDTNKDRRWYSGFTSDPNDLVITGNWGHDPIPEEVMHATKAMALWYTKRPDASLSGSIQTPEGNVLDLSQLPVEVKAFIDEWKLTRAVASVG